MNADDHLDRMLAELDADSAAETDSTVRELHAELATLADDLRLPLPPDPHREESAFCRAAELVRAIGRNPSPDTLAAAESDPRREIPLQELGDIGPYKVLAKLGQGGMGTVYKALHTRLEKVVALKVLPAERMNSPESVARFNREMKAVGKLDHPHLVRATDAGEADGTHFLVMEYVEGLDLAELIKRNGPLPVAAACELVRQAALGLQAAHSRGMVHRDVKPANLMLARQEFGPPVVKVLDLGLALLAETHAADATGLTADGYIMGTIDFMAPEQADDSHKVDGRADVYSLGATLFALLTGGSIFHGREFKSVMQKLSALATESAPSIRDQRDDVSEELAALVHRLLARDPAERFATPADVTAALQPFAEEAELSTLLANAPTADGGTETATWDTRKVTASSSEETIRPTAGTGRRSTARGRSTSRRPVVVAAVLLGGLVLLAGILLSLRTKHGEVVVELGDDVPAAMAKQLKIEVRGNGDVKVADAAQGWTIDVKEGKYTVQLAGGNDRFQLDKQQVTVSRGNKTFIRVTLKAADKVAVKPRVAHAPGSPWKPTTEQQAFFDAVALVPAEQQVATVAERLKTVNPGFDGKLKHRIEAGRVVSVDLAKAPVGELWPLAALTNLDSLNISRVPATNLASIGRLTALRSLNFAGVDIDRMPFVTRLKKLETLDCSDTWVRDLSPLAGLPLKTLRTFAISTYNEQALGVLKTCPKLETINGLPLKRFLARRDELERLRKILSAYSAERQLALVVEKLKEFNPGFDGKLTDHTIEKGRVTMLLWVDAPSITDLSPLVVLPLTQLHLQATRVSDLSPLRGMPLTQLNCGGTRVSDLSPLKGMPLTHLLFYGTRVSDLSPLQGMKLTILNCGGTRVSDLSPLKGMKLTSLACAGTRVSDLWPLKGMELTYLHCGGTRVSDLSPLKGMKLVELDCHSTRVFDLSPLKEMPLTSLNCYGTRVSHLSPLKGIKLTSLACNNTRISDLSPLKGMALTSLDCGSTQVADLSPLKGMPLTSLACNHTRISHLSPLKGMPLTSLDCGSTQVADLSPLKGIRLTSLACNNTRISDLSPLKGMPLTTLKCSATRVSDLSPLKGIALNQIWIDERLFHAADETLLRALPLKSYFMQSGHGQPADAFWKGCQDRRQAAEAFGTETAKHSADKQVAAVVAMMKKLNGNNVGAITRVIENDAVTEATFVLTVGTTDVTPLRAFTKLKKLTLTGGPYWLDISAVNSLPLEELTCTADIALRNAPVLRGMKTLKTINGQPAGKYLDSLTTRGNRKPVGGN